MKFSLRFGKTWGIATALIVASWAGSTQAQSVDQIVDASIKAIGGLDAVKAVKSVSRTGEVTLAAAAFGEMAGEQQIVFVPGEKAYQMMDLGIFKQTSGWDGETAWQSSDMTGLKKLEGDQAAQIKNGAAINAIVGIKLNGASAGAVVKLDDAKVGEADCHVLELTPAGSENKVKLFIDKASHFLIQTKIKQTDDTTGVEMDVTVTESDYQEFGGVKFSTKSSIELIGGPMGDMSITTSFTETTINGEIDDTIFAYPEPAAPAGE